MTPFNDILSKFFALIKDTDYNKLTDEELVELSKIYFDFSCAKFKELKKDLTFVKQGGQFYLAESLTTEEQIIIAYGMTVYWYEEKVNYNRMLRNVVNTKDFNHLSQANTLLRLTELLDYHRKEFNRLRKAYTENYKDFEGFN